MKSRLLFSFSPIPGRRFVKTGWGVVELVIFRWGIGFQGWIMWGDSGGRWMKCALFKRMPRRGEWGGHSLLTLD